MRLKLLTVTCTNTVHIQKHVWAIGIAINTLIRTHTCHTLTKTSGVMLLICQENSKAQSLYPQTHVHSLDCTQTHKCLLTGDTKNTLPWFHILTLAQCSFRRGKWALLIRRHQHTQALIHWYMCTCTLNCHTGRSYLCKHKDLLCILMRNNCKLLISWAHIGWTHKSAHTHMDNAKGDWYSSCSEAGGQNVPSSCGFL